jgi:hypothetical protein
MAELVDALASGASDLTVVEVRVLFWAPFLPYAEMVFYWRSGAKRLGGTQPALPLGRYFMTALN